MLNAIYRLVSPRRFEVEFSDLLLFGGEVIVRPTHLSICHADQRYYQALARQAPPWARQQLRDIAADEGSHARRLMAVYFLITGVRYWPIERPAPALNSTYPAVLRERFGEEQRGELAYLAAAEETADPCLRELYLELAGDENTHAWLIRGILEQL